jgi:FtsH-binding integral membrane protein
MQSNHMQQNQVDNFEDIYKQHIGQADTKYIASYMTKVYGWMTFGLALTFIIGFVLSTNEAFLASIYNFRMLLFIGQIAAVGFLAFRVHKMSSTTATMLFLAYAALNGLTFSLLFAMFKMSSMITVFAMTGGTFAIMTAVGYFTKQDLTSFVKLMFMGLVGVIIASIVNIFLGSSMLYYIISYVGVAVFVGLIAYDTQKIKAYALLDTEEERKKGAIMGALALYLDFINLFIYLLRLFGNRN